MAMYGMRERLVLRELSKDSRATVTQIAKVAKCSRVTAAKIIDKLRDELGIRFTVEIDPNRLVLEKHVIAIKLAKKPDIKFLEEVFRNEKYAMSVFLTDGDFDLIVISATSNPIEYIHWEAVIGEKLSDYGPTLKPSQMPLVSFGFIPLDTAFLEGIEEKEELDGKDRELLRILNENSRIGYSEMSRMTKMNEDTIRYKIFNLKKKGIIKRFTIAVQKPPKDYIMAFFENFRLTKVFEEHAAFARAGFMNADKELPILTTFQFTSPTTGSYGFFAIALFDSRREAALNVVRRHKIIYDRDSLEIRHAQIVRLVKGFYPFRNLDVRENFVVIKWE